MSETELYDLLEISPHASDSEIKKAYHKKARQYHPDKNPGHEEKFKEIQSAYEVLSDPQKREMYDRFGMSGVNGEASMGDPFGGGGIFSQLFGGGGGGFFGGAGQRRRPKGETIGIPLEVTLEEMYNGATKHVEYPRKMLCKTCNGSGGKSGAVSSCRNCRGSGIHVTLRQIGPGMMQQMQSKCSDCSGTGDYIKEKDKCKKCKGKRLIEITHKQEVPVSMGMKHEQKIPFSGMADEMPDGDPGDVIVVLQQMDHATFKRDDCDLIMNKTVSLREALCGFTTTVDHLDGRKLKLSCGASTVLYPDCVQGLENEGMPVFRRPDVKGNLYVKFTLEFPDTGFLTHDKLKELEKLLPARPESPPISAELEEVHMINSEDAYTGIAIQSDSDDDDDDDRRGGQRVGCSQQ